MKLHEAMLLGSTTMSAKPGALISTEDNTACAFGMAAHAIGCSFSHENQLDSRSTVRTANAELLWPWTLEISKRPCRCWFVKREMKIRDIIVHLFDRHVFGEKNWNIDDLAKWIALVEPAEPAAERFPLSFGSVVFVGDGGFTLTFNSAETLQEDAKNDSGARRPGMSDEDKVIYIEPRYQSGKILKAEGEHATEAWDYIEFCSGHECSPRRTL